MGASALPSFDTSWKAVEEGRAVKAFADPPKPVEGRKVRSVAAPRGTVRVEGCTLAPRQEPFEEQKETFWQALQTLFSCCNLL